MVLLTILAIIVLLLTLVVVVAITVGGTAAIVIFGDVIVCIFVLGWIIKKLWKRHGRKK